ncbi:Pre-mRNA-splicing factor 38 [Heracleum sosnowskyi]|uniref:Pre-mRNA-splicing factor 38 n=1 Tax=Heracleum sosnowskyi TaxID=360622 RepID=A0AAD8MNJ1_9APIA|nr:Pre-mRNA-splicing factor 38 [Heracleum sosnowskyi]
MEIPIKPIDQLLEKVLLDHVEPWMTGNCRGPSTAFCLLYKFFTMKLTAKQMHVLLDHPDSPYIRAVGFLYLRYAADPKTLWGWFEPYIKDVEEFSPGSNGRMTTMGVYIRDLLLGQYYFDTLFPRIPVPVMRLIQANLEKLKLPTKHVGVTGETTRGSDDTARRPPSVKASLSVSFGQRAPHRASTRDSSPVRRNMLPPSNDRKYDDDARRSPSRPRSKSRDLADHEYGDRDRDRGRDRDRDGSRGRDGERFRDRERDSNGYRDRNRDRDRSRDRDRRHDYDRKSRESSRRDYYDKSRSHDGGRYHSESSRRSRSRSRSRSHSIQTQRTSADRFPSPRKDEGPVRTSASSNLAKLKDMYGDLSTQKEDAESRNPPNRVNGAEEVIRLGGSTWK